MIHGLINNQRLIRFGIVGVSGVVINSGLLALLTEVIKLDYRLSSIIAIEVSILSNFMLNNFWTWKDREKRSFRTRLLRYHVSAGISALLFNWGLLVLFTEVIGLHYLVSNLVGILFGMISNFLLNNFWTFKNRK